MHNEHDEAVDKVLAALSKVTPPEDMEDRITQRMQQRAATPFAFRWRDRFVSPAFAGAYWWGALTGATAALFVFGCMLTLSRSHVTPSREFNALRPAADIASTLKPVRSVRAEPCPPARLLTQRAPTPAQSPAHTPLPSQSSAAVSPLTPQERELVRVARIAAPDQLAVLNPETQAKLNAEDAAEFEKFFTPPPLPKQEAVSE